MTALDKEEDEVHLICAYLKPLSGYARHKLIKNKMGYNTSVPLNTIADMARPCSDTYMKFVISVEEFRKKQEGKSKEILTALLNETILPEDIANACLVFVGGLLNKSTGNTLNVDGGIATAFLR